MQEHSIDLMKHAHLTRQLDIIPVQSLGMPVTIIGCGAIGSFLGLSLAKMGLANITLYDHDTVSIENMSNQFFPFSAIDTNKATALQQLIQDFTRIKVTAHPFKFEADPVSVMQLRGVVVVAVDSMEARRNIFEAIKMYGFGVTHIIDPRMGAEEFHMYTIQPRVVEDQATYEKTLYSDSEAVQERCTAKSTVYTSTLASGMVVKAIKNILLKEAYPRVTLWNIKASSNAMVMYAGGL